MKKYEEINIEIIKLSNEDVIVTSAFNGEDDDVYGW